METSKQAALLAIDVQRGLFGHDTPVCEAEKVLTNIQLLVDKAHAAKVPVFYIQHSTDKVLLEGTESWQLIPAMKPLSMDHSIHKHHGNAFEDAPLKGELDALHMGKQD